MFKKIIALTAILALLMTGTALAEESKTDRLTALIEWAQNLAKITPAREEDTAGTEKETENVNTQIQYVMYLGTNDKDTNQPVFTPEEAMVKAQEILIRHFGGYTIQEARGGWLDSGILYQEYTLVIYLSDTTPEAIHAAADELVEVFRQSSVLIQANPTTTEFYSGTGSSDSQQ